jgi:26S proteasome regulatory subunit N1
MVAGLYLQDSELRMNAYNLVKNEITTATSSMTSIPRPLKFLRLHYAALKDYESKFEARSEADKQFQLSLRDLLAVLVMVTPDITETALSWVLQGSKKNLTSWGQEFMHTLSTDISKEYLNRLDQEKAFDDLLDLVSIIVPFLIEQHSENEAVDLLLEVEKLDTIMDLVNPNNYKRICLYLMASSNYAADTDEQRSILEITYNIYSKFKEYANALRVAIKMNNMLFIKQTFLNCPDFNMQKQLAFILGKQRIYLSDDMDAELQTIISNLKLSEYYKKLATELDVLEPKAPEDVLKSHLEEKKSSDASKIDSYKMNMAYSMVSAFVNAGFGTEKLLSAKDSDWLGRNKEEGLISLLGGLGLVNLWDIDLGPNQLEKYMNVDERDPNKRAGYNIGVGIISSGVRDENNIAFAMLSEQLKDKNLTVKTSALFGLGLAYAGSQNDDLSEPLLEVLEDFSFGFEASAFTSLSFGLTFLGSGNDEVIGNLISILIARNDGGKGKLMESPYLVLYTLGMGLVLLGQQKDADLMIEATQLEDFPVEMRMFIKTLLTACAYAGSGNVVKVQELMHLVAKNKDEIHAKVQSIAVIGISLISLGEEIGMEMVLRSFNHFLQYGDVSVKKSVSLALSLLK